MKIKLKGVKNIRDFSEYGYKDFIRSAHLNKATWFDVKILTDQYNVKTVIDLRTDREVLEKPDARLPGVDYIHIPIFNQAVPGVSHEKDSDKVGRLENMIPDMREFYRLLVTEEPFISNIKKVMSIICDKNRKGAVLWHCTEGKDRCGIISAIFLLSKGFSYAEVMDDYLLTAKTNNIKAKKYYFLVLLALKGRKFAAKVRDAFMAKSEYIEPIMDLLNQIATEYVEG